ncbi:MAG: hypothetical protein OXG39_17355 [Chloroflexi bacterium]|nr:hypothetical protein [Chloroflexota bacterium]
MISLLLFTGTTLVACRASDLPLTATAEYEAAATQLGQLRTTATVARARLQITLDFAGTRVSQIEQSGAFLRSNLSALGTDAAFIDANLRQLRDQPQVVAVESREETAAVGGASPAIDLDDALSAAVTVSPPARVEVTPPTSVEATPDSLPRLDNLVLSSGVNSEDCQIDVNPLFTPDSTVIYVVARAYDIPAGATLSSSWRHRDQELVSHSFQTEHLIDDNCIWFFIDQTDTAFTAGRWAVQISLDGSALSPLLPFEVVEN